MRRVLLIAAASAFLALPAQAIASDALISEHPGTAPSFSPPDRPGLRLIHVCRHAAHDPRLSADQQAAVAAACSQLRSDLHAAASRFAGAVKSARDEVRPAIEAAIAACGNGQFASDACQQARSDAEQAKRQAIRDVIAAHRRLLRDVHTAISTFKSSLRALRNG